MKNIVIKYGTISGIIAATLIFVSIFIEQRKGFGGSSEIIGYLGVILAFIPIFLGVRSFRDTIGEGYITFMKALTVGFLIIVISGLYFSLASLISDYWLTPDLPDKYSKFMVDQIKSSGKNLSDTAVIKQQIIQYKELSKNPLIIFALTFTETLPLGVIMTLICAAFLRKNPIVNPDITDAVVVEEEPQNPS